MPIGEHGVMLSDADLVAFLPTADLDRARAFFSQVIGLPIVDDTPFACVFESKGTLLRVALVDEVRPVSYTVLGWSPCPTRQKPFAGSPREASRSSASKEWTRTSWVSGQRPAVTLLLGSRIPTAMSCR
jgi:hypothetical protein